MNETITSLQNEQDKIWRSLNRSHAARVKHGLFLAEGEHMAQEAVKERKARSLLVASGGRACYASLLADAAAQGVSVYFCAPHVLEAVSDTKTPQGVTAVCGYPQADAVRGSMLVALDGVQDPGNIGTILRTMDAAGFCGLLMDEKTADPCGPKALRASMGGSFRIPFLRCASLPDALADLKQRGYTLIAGDLRGQDLFQRKPVPAPCCLIIGNEGQGISPAVLEMADVRLKIPIPGKAESLNAAVAAAILMYDLLRDQRMARAD